MPASGAVANVTAPSLRASTADYPALKPSRMSTNSDYRIEKDRLIVGVNTVGGQHIGGAMFVQAYARHRKGPEDPRDVVNDADAFFPLELHDGTTRLIAKEHVLELEIAGDESIDAGSEMLARAARVEITLLGGRTRTGIIFLEVPFDRPRLLDFLNRFHERFITLRTEHGVSLINRRLVELVRPLD